jgi:mannose-6-phosphate isomerase-like protein (cupin superfamily)
MPPLKIDLAKRAGEEITGLFDPHLVASVNDAAVKIAKFGPEFAWHAHEDEDEAFLVLEGEIAIDFSDGTVCLSAGEFLMVPRGTGHRPRALSEAPIVLMFEKATTLNTGNAEASELTVRNLKTLTP